jgi:hypothetical protein
MFARGGSVSELIADSQPSGGRCGLACGVVVSDLFTWVFDRGGNRSPLLALSTETEAVSLLAVPLGPAAAASMLAVTTTKPATKTTFLKYARRIDLLRMAKVAFAKSGP